MGFTREFAKNNKTKKRSAFKSLVVEWEIPLEVMLRNLNILYGSHISKDTKVVINNVTVSFFCLKLAAKWRCGCALKRNLRKMDVYEAKITNKHKILCASHKKLTHIFRIFLSFSKPAAIPGKTQTTAIATT